MAERLNVGDLVEVCYRGYVVSEHPFSRMVRVMIEDGPGVQYVDAFGRHVRRLKDDHAPEPNLGLHSE